MDALKEMPGDHPGTRETPPQGHNAATPLVDAGGVAVKRRPIGPYAENKPDPDGVWRKTAPIFQPCRYCGEITSLMRWCAKCREWATLASRVVDRHAELQQAGG